MFTDKTYFLYQRTLFENKIKARFKYVISTAFSELLCFLCRIQYSLVCMSTETSTSLYRLEQVHSFAMAMNKLQSSAY